jgi:nitrate/TMAO reductase-like tetraheme cytochrome c subunit
MRSDACGRGLAEVWILATILACSTVSAGNEDYWSRPVPVQGPAPLGHLPLAREQDPESCGLCHPTQYSDWRASHHAKAAREGLLGQLDALDEATRQECLDCHAPRAEQQALWQDVKLASMDRSSGVDCAACHLRRNVRHGPRRIARTPHGAVVENSLFHRSEFCAPCHQFDEEGLSVNGKPLEDTYAEWAHSRYAREGITCQACHMPRGDHGFKGIHDPATTRRGLLVQAMRTREGVTVRATNAGAGHALPTYVTPRIVLTIASPAHPVRRVQHPIHRRMDWDPETGWGEIEDTRLAPDESAELMLPLPSPGQAAVTVEVAPDADYHDRVYPDLLELLGDKLSSEARALLERARGQAKTSRYTLYRFRCPAWSGTDVSCPEAH